MATFQVPIYGQLGLLYANHLDEVWYEVFDASGAVLISASQAGLTERTDYNGSPSGVYRAIINADAGWNYPLSIEWTVSGGDGEGVLAVDTVGWEFALIRTKGASLDLTQGLSDVQDETVGGALAGAWALSWGRMFKNLVNKTLNLFGPGNVSETPSEMFQLDDVTNPTERVPLSTTRQSSPSPKELNPPS